MEKGVGARHQVDELSAVGRAAQLELTAGVTTIVISHRFSTVRRADRIVVVESGRIVEEGDHRSLLEADGRYARMFRLQAAHFAESEAPGASEARVVGDG